MTVDPGALAVRFLLATRTDDGSADELAAALAGLDEQRLFEGLRDDAARLAFWLDIYNAVVQRQPADAMATFRRRLRFFRAPLVTVAGQALSLDGIEQGILRRSHWKLGLGYLSDPRPSPFERRHRLRRIDPRIHFALNCGAASCPPIAAYQADRIEEQLDLATRSYLAREVQTEPRIIRAPAVMLWFIGDFGGTRGVRRFLAEHGIDSTDRGLRFRRWDWTPDPDNWSADT